MELTYRLCFTRPPDAAEMTTSLNFLEQYNQRFGGEQAETDRKIWTVFCHALLASAEFRYIE